MTPAPSASDEFQENIDSYDDNEGVVEPKSPRRRGRKRKAPIETETNDVLTLESQPAIIPQPEQNSIKIADIQATCTENLTSFANKMAQQHIHKLGEAKVGDTVQVPVPDVDRGPADLIHILAYITQINKLHMTYQLATKHGIITGWHARKLFISASKN